jgi:hypothetical protein
MTEMLTPDHFRPHIDKLFRVQGGRHALTLTEVDAPAAQTTGGFRQSFNVIFKGPPEDVLREGLYTFDVEDGPSFDLYVMPIHTPAPGRQDYQALFN